MQLKKIIFFLITMITIVISSSLLTYNLLIFYENNKTYDCGNRNIKVLGQKSLIVKNSPLPAGGAALLLAGDKQSIIELIELKDQIIVVEVLEEPDPALVIEEISLTPWRGRIVGPSGEETYYNLPMGQVIYYMELLGYEEEYWIREDGCKMYGEYIIIAADTNIRPKGTILETSLGWGIVCDHCVASETNPGQIDIAVNW